jgi:hypothetical protein
MRTNVMFSGYMKEPGNENDPCFKTQRVRGRTWKGEKFVEFTPLLAQASSAGGKYPCLH